MFIVQLLLLQVMIFIGLVLVLRQLMAKHATTATAHLQGLSQDYLKKQDELKKRLEEVERRYQEQLAKAQEETEQLKARALQEADALRQRAVAEAHQEAEHIVQQAAKVRQALEQELVQSMDARAVERACELMQEALPVDLREAIHVQWVNALIKNGLVSGESLSVASAAQAGAPAADQAAEVRVVSAFPLTAPQRASLGERLKKAVGSAVALQETVDPRLVAGLTITIGHLVLDGSLSSKLLEAARQVQGDRGR